MPIINHHNFLSCQGKEDLHWEQCVRMLLVNTVPQLTGLQTYVNKIIENILSHPTEEKYLKLRCSNTVLQRNIFSVNGGQELLLSLGFQFDLDPVTNEKYLVFPLLPMLSLPKQEEFVGVERDPQQIASEYIDRLQSCEQWLENTIHVCIEFQQTKLENLQRKGGKRVSGELEEVPADSIIQLQLPTSKIVIGGFMKGDSFVDVWQFACSFFTPDRHDLVELRLPHESYNVLKEDYSRTIEELRYFPRTKFFVTALDASQASNMKLIKSQTIAVETKAIDRKKLYQEKMKKKEERMAQENERLRTIKAFRDDRSERKLKGGVIDEQEEKPTKATIMTLTDLRKKDEGNK